MKKLNEETITKLIEDLDNRNCGLYRSYVDEMGVHIISTNIDLRVEYPRFGDRTEGIRSQINWKALGEVSVEQAEAFQLEMALIVALEKAVMKVIKEAQ